MPQRLDQLLQDCTVKITIPGQSGWGTGFFVAPGLILTCDHVVRRSPGQVQVRWQHKTLDAVVEQSISDPYDLALLRVALVADGNPPCVWLDEDVQPRDPLYLFGYPDEGDRQGEPRTFNCDGITGSDISAILFNLGQVRPGMSGSPLLNQRTGKVCGMVKFTRDRSIDLGGGAIPARVILEQFPQLRKLQQAFHRGNHLWNDLVTKPDHEVEFQPYLQALTKRYEKWWTHYTLTDATGKAEQPAPEQPPIFDFGLMVQTVEKKAPEEEANSLPQKREKTERLPVLGGIRKYADDHVLLVGRPGSGKSTALIRLLLEEATALTPSPLRQAQDTASPEIERGEPERIPVLVELRYWSGSVFDLIREFLHRHDPKLALDDASLTTLLGQGRLLLLIDGLNELPSEGARTDLSAFRRNYPKLPMIFTTRDLGLGGDLGIEKKLEMQPLTEPQMKDFIRAYVPDQAEAMLRQLNNRLREFGQTPLLLWMLCEVFQQSPNRQMPTNLAEVFRAFTTMYEDSSVRKHEVALLKGDVRPLSDRRLWKEALQTLAALMMQGETPMGFRVAIHRTEAERKLGKLFANEKFPVRDILDDLLKYHLLQNRTTDQLEFRHQLIQEYYAAEHLLCLLPELSDERLKRGYLNLLKWTEPVALMLALVDQKAQALRVVRLAIDEVDLILGAKLAGSVRPAFQETTIRWLNALEVPLSLKIQCWEISHSKLAVSELLHHARNNLEQDVCWKAAAALGNIGDETATCGLLDMLNCSDFSKRRSAIAALEKVGDPTVVDALSYHLLNDSDFRLRLQVIRALSKIGSDPAVSALHAALAHLNSEDVINSELCKFIKTELTQLDMDSKTYEALSNIEPLKSVDDIDLLNALNHPSAKIRKDAVLALRKAASSGSLEIQNMFRHLVSMLSDSDTSVRHTAIEILVEIDEESALSTFLNIAKDSDPIKRQGAVEVLSYIDNERANFAIFDVLDDPDRNVSRTAAIALKKINNRIKRVMKSGLVHRLKHLDPFVRARVAEELGHTEDDQVTLDLLHTLYSENEDIVVRSVAGALKELGNPLALNYLWQVYRKDAKIEVWHAISAIQNHCAFYNYSIHRGINKNAPN